VQGSSNEDGVRGRRERSIHELSAVAHITQTLRSMVYAITLLLHPVRHYT
jgi:hypothetical protein